MSRQGLSTFEAVSSTQLMTAGPVNGSEVEVDELGERPESTRDIKEALELAPSTPTHKARWIKHTLPSGLVIEVEDKGRNGPAGTQSWSINHPTAHVSFQNEEASLTNRGLYHQSTRASKAPCIQTTPDDEDSYLADIDDDIDASFKSTTILIYLRTDVKQFEIYEDAYPVDWRTNLPRQGGDIYWERRMLGLDSDEEVVDSDQE